MSKVKIALVQSPVEREVEDNLRCAAAMVKEAAGNGADIVVLPEMFCCQYFTKAFIANKEPAGGRIWSALKSMAIENKVMLVGGTMPEEDGSGKIYNTCFVFNAEGRQIARHRKMHLFDIDIPGRQTFRESDTFTPGDDVTVIDTEFGRIGIEVCFDIRFPELTRLMALQGAQMIIVPAAFNMTTGPAHWELLFRSRAMDNQIFLFGCSPARTDNGRYLAYAHSLYTDPWGSVKGGLDEKAGILYCEPDLPYIQEAREQLPYFTNRRTDIYSLGFAER